MTSRRSFLMTAGATAGFLSAGKARAAKSNSSEFPHTEFESRIARRDFRDITKDVLPTPCMVVVDDPLVVDWVEQAAAARNAKLKIAVSVWAGMARQGVENGQPAVDLAQKVMASKRMELEGFMAYSGGASHTKTWAARRKK